MNVFVSTWIKLPWIKHSEIAKIFKEGKFDESFCTTIVRSSSKNYGNHCNSGAGVSQIKTKGSYAKFLVSDCFVKSGKDRKVPCWHCRERQGYQKNGTPFTVEYYPEFDSKKIEKYGYFCDNSCMYTFSRDRAYPGSPYYELYKDACDNAEALHALQYPGKGCLVPANPWELLIFNGGTLPYNMWKDPDLTFHPLPGYSNDKVTISYVQK
jgi:hypothetical protein